VSYPLNPVNKCLFLFLIEGGISVDDVHLAQRDAIGIWDTGSITIQCDATSYFLIIETPINQK
jgi:redox-sensitive bicupin YhaK (pirin superfamily)